MRGIHRWPVNSPRKGQWPGGLIFSLICARTNDGVSNRDAGHLRRHGAHYDVTAMMFWQNSRCFSVYVSHWYSHSDASKWGDACVFSRISKSVHALSLYIWRHPIRKSPVYNIVRYLRLDMIMDVTNRVKLAMDMETYFTNFSIHVALQYLFPWARILHALHRYPYYSYIFPTCHSAPRSIFRCCCWLHKFRM